MLGPEIASLRLVVSVMLPATQIRSIHWASQGEFTGLPVTLVNVVVEGEEGTLGVISTENLTVQSRGCCLII